MEVTIQQCLDNQELLQKIIDVYNNQRKRMQKYYEKNRDKLNDKSKNYYYEVNGIEKKTENKTADKKKYMKEYRQKLKEKREQNLTEN
jgi:hypothetical protein